MNTHVHTRRSTQPLDEPEQAILRELVAERGGATRVAEQLGVERGAITRAAAGIPVLRGTARLIRDGLDRLRERGELPAGGPNAA